MWILLSFAGMGLITLALGGVVSLSGLQVALIGVGLSLAGIMLGLFFAKKGQLTPYLMACTPVIAGSFFGALGYARFGVNAAAAAVMLVFTLWAMSWFVMALRDGHKRRQARATSSQG